MAAMTKPLIVLVVLLAFGAMLLRWRWLTMKTREGFYPTPSTAAAPEGIPRHIFRIGPADAYETVNREVFDEIRKDNPEYDILYYDDESALEFLKAELPYAVDAYTRLVPGAYKADLLRYCLLYKYGGVYSDLTL